MKKKSNKKINPIEPKKPKINYFKWIILGLIVVVLGLLIVQYILYFATIGRVAYGLKMGGVSIGGKSYAEVENVFDTYLEKMKSGLVLDIDGKIIENITPAKVGVWVEMDKCKDEVLSYGHSRKLLERIAETTNALTGKKNISCPVKIDSMEWNDWSNGVAKDVDVEPVQAGIEKKDGKLVVVRGKNGEKIDKDDLKKVIAERFSNLYFENVKVSKKNIEPLISDTDAQTVLDLAEKGMDFEKIDLVYKDWNFPLSKTDYFDWLAFIPTKDESKKDDEKLSITFDYVKVGKFFNDNASGFEVRPVNAKLAMTADGPVVVQSGEAGFMVNRMKFVEILEKNISKKVEKIELPVEKLDPEVAAQNIAKLDIKELIASGTSDFSWSPANRIHNIEVGAENFNGTLIAPGEEFSFTGRLGPVDASSGYLPELVIAGNETRPEYGGGLCQVSTTMFRVAINAGLPITERHPHQYRVSYYEPAGMDSTIYVPSPDLRFVNDTGSYILIESVINGSNLTFNFYGKKDGRKVEVTEPYIYNITSPPASIMITTDALAPGERVQVDTAHAGADAIFYRTITDKSGVSNKEEFFSHYVAWPAKYKVGAGEVKNDNTEKTENSQENDLSKVVS